MRDIGGGIQSELVRGYAWAVAAEPWRGSRRTSMRWWRACRPLQKVERVAMHRADVHLGKPEPLEALLLQDGENALLELGRGLLGESERDDVPRLDVELAEDGGDPLRDHLRLIRASAR